MNTTNTIDSIIELLSRDLGLYLILSDINLEWTNTTFVDRATFTNKREFFEVRLREFYHKILLGEDV